MATTGKMVWLGRGISALAALAFGMSAAMKFVGGPQVEEGMAHLGIAAHLAAPLGILELSCTTLYLIPATAVLGAILLAGYMGGAICSHLRVGDPFYVEVILGVLVWLGLYLREGRLKELIPLRRAPGGSRTSS